MEYPFKDLMPLDEATARDGYYKDWAHLDPEVFYSLTQISEYIKTKGYGVDVRLLIAQLAEHFGLKTTQVVDLANLLQQKFTNLEGVTQSFTNNINSLVAQMEADKDAIIANATVDSEVILARGGKATLGQRLDETTAQLAQTVGISISQFPRLESETDDRPRFQRAIDFLSEQRVGSSLSGTLIIPKEETPYVIDFVEGSTVENPTRIEITSDNIHIKGVDNPRILMRGLTLEYLNSIDDYASSGRDIFTVFSFMGVENPQIEGIDFEGEYDGTSSFRYQSPRAIAVAFKGTKNAVAKNISGKNILGNVVNGTNSHINYDAPYSETIGTTLQNLQGDNCLENAFNMMGGTRNTFVSDLYATKSANGFESASKGMIMSDCIFEGNRGSALGLSGENMIISNVIGTGSTGEDGKNNGYGLIITGGRHIQINGGDFTKNKAESFTAYPGVEDVQFNGTNLSDSGEGSAYNIMITLTGTAEKKIKRVSFTGCILHSKVIIANMNQTEEVSFVNCKGDTLANSSLIFNAQSTSSRAVNNKFNKPVTMNDISGESHSNGLYRTLERTSIPTTGTWRYGDIIINPSPSIGGWKEARVLQGGTFGTDSEPVIRVSSQNGHLPTVSSAPQFIGQLALTSGSTPKAYIATGTNSTNDWLQVG